MGTVTDKTTVGIVSISTGTRAMCNDQEVFLNNKDTPLKTLEKPAMTQISPYKPVTYNSLFEHEIRGGTP